MIPNKCITVNKKYKNANFIQIIFISYSNINIILFDYINIPIIVSISFEYEKNLHN